MCAYMYVMVRLAQASMTAKPEYNTKHKHTAYKHIHCNASRFKIVVCTELYAWA